ncbi:NUDIX hydrolase [Pararhodobacter oceanensis]|uniref:NUDIX hydrolase n=1 Tax=Pararhodobacter oceanensis TaxID=2172121 RepID=A0A2T8HRU3_9RHOB|nr:NUDIX hydrolase [Pararhodobacter oceanensis]PVH28135.1 NUDIX hydrolase [Pararhodobacter oceanensis]
MKLNAMTTFRDYVEPVFRRPNYVQTGALCLRQTEAGREVLLVTSLGGKRWIVPKGWPMKNRTLAEAAQQEAWEEAGVKGRVEDSSLGTFSYRKLVKGGIPVTCDCELFTLQVDEIAEDWPERKIRNRAWMTINQAIEAVSEEGLREILRAL